MWPEHITALLLGFFIDLLLGDPPFLWHPVRGIGWLVRIGETALRRLLAHPGSVRRHLPRTSSWRRYLARPASPPRPAGPAPPRPASPHPPPPPGTGRSQCLAGVALVGFVSLATFLAAAGILHLAGLIHPRLRFAVQAIMSWQILALKSLKTESMKVYHQLKAGDIPAARAAVSMIVGRDTAGLDDTQIVKAAVETVAENTSDGVVAPFLYLLLGGPPLGFLYKAINTMDSMVGYHNEQYEYFGKAAARLDDAINWLPARLAALLMVAAAWILRYDGRGAGRIFRRDRFQHKSPNSAQTESVCAGALGIRLAGDAGYFGKIVKKPYIGDDTRPAVAEDIKRANRLLYGTAFLLVGIAASMTAGGYYLWMVINTGGIFTAIK